MSGTPERMKALIEALEADEAFAADFRRAVEERSVEETTRLAAAKGIELAPEDFAPGIVEGELDEDELKAVAGGFSWDELFSDLQCIAAMFAATMH